MVRSSDNVFADLGFDQPDDLLLKAELVLQIIATVRSRNITEAQAAESLEISESDFLRMLNGHFCHLTIDHLTNFLIVLDSPCIHTNL